MVELHPPSLPCMTEGFFPRCCVGEAIVACADAISVNIDLMYLLKCSRDKVDRHLRVSA